VTLIWNEAAQDPELGLKPVTVPSFRGPVKRVDLLLLPRSFVEDRDSYLAWCAVTDPFAVDARPRPLAARTLKLSRDQIHAAATALVKSGTPPENIRSLADLVTVSSFKSILRQRLAEAGGQQKSFNFYLARALVRIAGEWVKVETSVLAELKRLASKLKAPKRDLTPKNKAFLRQFDDPRVWQRLKELPGQLWQEVKSKRDEKPNFRTLAKAQAALAMRIPTYMPVRPENLSELEFDKHLFVRLSRELRRLSNWMPKRSRTTTIPASIYRFIWQRCCGNTATTLHRSILAIARSVCLLILTALPKAKPL
jgi:hypothetical protein